MLIEGDESENILIRRGVRQNCVLSSPLFYVYSEQIFLESLEDTNSGVKINGEYFNNIPYTDDTVVFASSLEVLRRIVVRVAEISERYGLSLNFRKPNIWLCQKPMTILVNSR